MVSIKFYGVQGGFTKTALLGGNSQIAGQSPIIPSESAIASFDSLMDVKSAFALLLTRVTELFIRFVDYKNKGKVIL